MLASQLCIIDIGIIRLALPQIDVMTIVQSSQINPVPRSPNTIGTLQISGTDIPVYRLSNEFTLVTNQNDKPDQAKENFCITFICDYKTDGTQSGLALLCDKIEFIDSMDKIGAIQQAPYYMFSKSSPILGFYHFDGGIVFSSRANKLKEYLSMIESMEEISA